MAINVFQRDDRVVDHAREGQSEDRQDHGVDRAAQQIQESRRSAIVGNRDGQEHGDGGARAAEKDQNDNADQRQADHALMQHRVDGFFYENGLIENEMRS